MILARLLFLKDYGLIGMTVVFRVFVEFGFSSNLIQRKKEILTQQYLSTVFWANLFWSVFSFWILFFLIAPLASNFYNESAQFPTPAKRPFYSVLNKNKIKEKYKIEVRYWRYALKECLNKIED